MALNFSSTDQFSITVSLPPTVAYMMAFLMGRFFAAAVFSAFARPGPASASARALLPALRNSRRFRCVLIVDVGGAMAVAVDTQAAKAGPCRVVPKRSGLSQA